MIQDIAPHKFHNEYRPDAVLTGSSPIICFDGRKMLARAGEEGLILPTASMLGSADDIHYAFAIDETEYFLYAGKKTVEVPGFSYEDIRTLRRCSGNMDGMIMFTGFHLCQWYKDFAYCGRCGGRNEHHPVERAMHCPVCNRNMYPRIMPAVIIGVIDGDRLLLTKYREGFNNYALVAGFTEIGETLEETVSREVMEEAGLRVKNIRYYKSQPWGLAGDILAGFYCDVDGSNEIRMDENELKLAQFMTRDEIVLQPDSFSLTNEMMKRFKDGLIC